MTHPTNRGETRPQEGVGRGGGSGAMNETSNQSGGKHGLSPGNRLLKTDWRRASVLQ